MTSSFSASHLILAAVALVVGLALGGLMPRSEVRGLRDRVAELEARDCEGGGGGNVGQQIASALRSGRGWSRAPSPGSAPSPGREPGRPQGASGAEDVGGEPEGALPPGGGRSEGREPRPGGLSGDRVDEVMDALDMRRAQARQALREQAQLSGEQELAVDAAVEEMNVELQELALDFVAEMEATGGLPDRRQSMLFARDTIDVLVTAEDAIWNTLDPSQREQVDPTALDPTSYVDGTVVQTLGQLEAP